MSGKLILVPTPIGNLEDITLRSLRVLKESNYILAEDTRTSGKLLKHFEINTPLRPYHMHNEHKISSGIIRDLQGGSQIVLISDAGTPGISDPGFLLCREAIRNDISVEVLPGATAFVPALLLSGLPAHNFAFEGFLPVKKGRKTRLQELASESRTIIFYESPYRIVKTLEDLSTVMGPERNASISREITKMFEETRRGSLQELADYFKEKTPKGEFVICVEGRSG